MARSRIAGLGLAAALAYAASCASPGIPPGGPPDVDAPQIRRLMPDSNALNVNAKSVLIHFNEVVAERPSGTTGMAGLEAIVSLSPSDGRERVTWRRTAIEIEPRRGFRPNTAYRVTIQPGVMDLRNNRMTAPIEFVFSTGPSLASGAVHGVVFDWAAGRAARDARVEVFLPTDSSFRWNAASDSSGRFAVRDLMPGTYHVRVWTDENKDRRLDQREAFDSTTLTLADTASLELYTFVQDTLLPPLTSITVADSLTLQMQFERGLVAEWDGTGAVAVRTPDSTLVASGDLVPRARWDSLRRVAGDTAGPADTTGAADTAGLAADPAAAQVPDSAGAEPDTTTATGPVFRRTVPIQAWIVGLDTALTPGRYILTIRGVRGLNGRVGDIRREFRVAEPPPRRAPADTTRVPADSTRVVPPDSTRLPR